jgi:8-oxo-dGTP pyrophosphatase MutT (NUDIX family)
MAADPFCVSSTFLTASSPLAPSDAVAAIIVNEDNHVLLQLRDDKAEIFFPHHWGCFGGGIEDGEDAAQSLLRELDEELGLAFDASALEKFITIAFTLTPNATRAVDRHFFIIRTSTAAMQHITLGEGQRHGFFPWQEMMAMPNVTPYDKFAMWVYFNQARLPKL